MTLPTKRPKRGSADRSTVASIPSSEFPAAVAVEELRFVGDGIEVVLLPGIGARLHRLRAFGHDVLRTPADVGEHVRDPFFWGAYIMAPWCNRIEPGPVRIGSRRICLGPNFADGWAIHGQVFARPWERRPDGTLRVRGGGDGWPWRYEVGLGVEVVGPSVRIALTLINMSEDPMPGGLGLHPWFRKPVLVAVRGDAVHPENVTSAPRPEPVHERHDLREIGEMPAGLDATWTELADPPVELRWPDARVRLAMRITSPTAFVVAASPGLDAIAVEPQTHSPQGLRRLLNGEPGGLKMLDSGEVLTLGVELAFERLEEDT